MMQPFMFNRFLALLFCASISSYSSTYDVLIEQQIISPGSSPSLHLGCGTNYLEGYVNIDFPADNHTVQSFTVADYFADITRIQFPNSSVSCVRNHHFFEHFNRNQALAMLCAWHLWLKQDGLLIIETPDFECAIKRLLKTRDYVTQQRILRHVFGSHEAFWAIHCDGWYKEKFKSILSRLGFEIQDIHQYSYLMTDNIIIHAKKTHALDISSLRRIAAEILKESTINDDERKMHEVFCEAFSHYLDQMVLAEI